MHCFFCGSDTHTQENCPDTAAGLVGLHCTFCGSESHSLEACPKTVNGITRRYQPWLVEKYFVKEKR
jgi:hypothetical protein